MKSRMIPVLCILLLFLTACQKQTSDDPVVATYKDTQILQSEVAYKRKTRSMSQETKPSATRMHWIRSC